MQQNSLDEVKKFVKKLSKKIKKEGSTTAGVAGYATPNAFVGDPKSKGSIRATSASTAYTIEPSKKKKFYIGYKDQGESLSDIKEANYKQFKEDTSLPQHKKVNQAILEINRKITEINRILNHSAKLKTEAQIGDEKLWKRTNEALLKMYKRLSEASKKVRSIANLKEIENASLRDKMMRLFQQAGMSVSQNNIDVAKRGNIHYIDVFIDGEPLGFDLENNMLTYQGFDKEVELGNINREQDIAMQLKTIL